MTSTVLRHCNLCEHQLRVYGFYELRCAEGCRCLMAGCVPEPSPDNPNQRRFLLGRALASVRQVVEHLGMDPDAVQFIEHCTPQRAAQTYPDRKYLLGLGGLILLPPGPYPDGTDTALQHAGVATLP